MISILVAATSGFIGGAILVILLDIFALWYWLGWLPKAEPKLVPGYVDVKHSKDIAEYCKTKGATPSESCMFLNLLIAFLWREWRDSTSTKRYFINKMNLEFQELLLYKAAGELMQNIQVKDYCLGDSLPIIKEATVMKIQSRSPDEVAQELDLALDVEYSGGFLISLVVDLIFGKTVSLAVKLNSLHGRVRLQFTRVPCTHWSFSFYEDPDMDIEVESQFNGRNLAKLTALIKSQIIKSVKRKHTLPRYKVRYKPFFRPPVVRDGRHDIFIHNSLITVGRLTVEVMDCSRLPSVSQNSRLYCILSLDSLPWKEDMPLKSTLWPVHEVVLRRTLSGSIGVTIKQSFHREFEFCKELIVIDTISPQSPANFVDIKRDDILLSINDINIDSLKQAIRLIKNGGDKLVFKLQRPLNSPTINFNDREVSDIENDKDGIDNAVKDVIAPGLESISNIAACDEDSDGDDFVNIVVRELEEQMGKGDETTRNALRKISQSTKQGEALNLNSEMNESIEVAGRNSDVLNPEARDDDNTDDGLKTIFGPVGESHDRSSIQVRSGKMTPKPQELLGKHSVFVGRKGAVMENMHDDVNRDLIMEHKYNTTQRQLNSIGGQIWHGTDRSIEIDNDSSDSQSFNSFNGDGDWDNISQQTLHNTEELVHKTSAVSCNVDPVWNETFIFDAEKHHRFLNVCVWSKSGDGNKDILIGYSSISLMEISLECLSTTSGRHTQSYILTPPYTQAGVSRTSLRFLMPGLKPETCNGDIKLSLCYKPSLDESDLMTEKQVDNGIDHSLVGSKNSDEFNGKCHTDEKEHEIQQMHEFVGMQFYFPTRCDYCQKKVWTKTAFQCRVCAMVSHKRCISNAHSNTYCTRYGVRAKPHAWCSVDDIPSKHIEHKEPINLNNGKQFNGKVQLPAEKRQIDLVQKSMEDGSSVLDYDGEPTTDVFIGKVHCKTEFFIPKDSDLNAESLQIRSRLPTTVSKEDCKSIHEAESMEHPLQRSSESGGRVDYYMKNAAMHAQDASLTYNLND